LLNWSCSLRFLFVCSRFVNWSFSSFSWSLSTWCSSLKLRWFLLEFLFEVCFSSFLGEISSISGNEALLCVITSGLGKSLSFNSSSSTNSGFSKYAWPFWVLVGENCGLGVRFLFEYLSLTLTGRWISRYSGRLFPFCLWIIVSGRWSSTTWFLGLGSVRSELLDHLGVSSTAESTTFGEVLSFLWFGSLVFAVGREIGDIVRVCRLGTLESFGLIDKLFSSFDFGIPVGVNGRLISLDPNDSLLRNKKFWEEYFFEIDFF